MNDHVDWNLLGKYLSGECTHDEKVYIDEWVASNPANARLLQELRLLWESVETGGLNPQNVDVDGAWSRLQERIVLRDKIKPLRQVDLPARPKQPRRRTSAFRYASRVAFLSLFVLLAVVVVLQLWMTDPVVVDQIDKTVSTQKGQRASIELSDGTIVRLNVDSRLTFPAEFAVDRREVILEGEAYFDVSKNEKKPFIIQANDGRVQVLGTSFGVRAYLDEPNVRVAVAEGLVSFRAIEAAAQDTVLLRANDIGILDEDSMPEVARNMDLTTALSWTENELRFRDTPFDQVVADLERWYALDIEVDLDAGAVLPLNATFVDESVGEILRSISAALDIKYDRDRRTIRFYN